MSQISLTFPDGNKREFAAGVTAGEVAASISTSLAKKAISATVNGARSLPAVSRQNVGWPRSQASHLPQLPSVVSTTYRPCWVPAVYSTCSGTTSEAERRDRWPAMARSAPGSRPRRRPSAAGWR